jgi:hypothetical protein
LSGRLTTREGSADEYGQIYCSFPKNEVAFCSFRNPCRDVSSARFQAAYAHGIVGNRFFLSPIVGNDAFPDNAFDLTMRRSNYEFSLLPAFEKQLTDDSSLLFVGSWNRVTPGARQGRVEGFGDLTISYRHALYISVPHELEVTLSPFLVVPTGTRRIADQGYTHLGGEMLLGKGLGDLGY